MGRTYTALFAIAALAVALVASPIQRAPAAGPACIDHAGQGFTARVCLTEPVDGTSLAGTQSVSATVTFTGTSPGVQRLVAYLDGEYLLTDYASPYTFFLDTTAWIDGSHRLEVEALLRGAAGTTTRAGGDVTFRNGVTAPRANPNTFTPSTGRPGTPFRVAATGDGAGGEPSAKAVSDLIAAGDPNLFLYLGDVYEKGTLTEFQNWYGAPFFGRFRSISNPTIGNHEYDAGGAAGYFDYWDNVPNYYSFDAGGWHFVALNSNGVFGQRVAGTGQYDWLAADLRSNRSACTLAFFHHPLFSVGPQGDTPALGSIWRLLANSGVDVVLTGHDHSYQRWVPLDGAGQPGNGGITQFVVGSGGHGGQAFVRTDSRLAAGVSEVPKLFGALTLTLAPDRATFEYRNTANEVLDSGTVNCSPALPASSVAFVGTPPSGGTALLVTGTGVTTATELAAALRAAGCGPQTLALLDAGRWRIHVVGAPPAVNAAFPPTVGPSTPFFVACRA